MAHYRSIRPNQKLPTFFAKAAVLGPKLTLFYDNYRVPRLGGQQTRLTVWGTRQGGRMETVFQYLLRDETGRMLLLSARRDGAVQKALSRFFKEAPELQELVRERVTGFESLPDFVRAVNGQAATAAAPSAR